MVNEHVQKNSPNLQAKERPKTWALVLPLGKQKGGVCIWPGALQNRETEHKLKNSAKEESKKRGKGILIEYLTKP